MKVYNRGILVAETRPEKEVMKMPSLWLIEGTPEELVPWSLFGAGKFRVNKISMDLVMGKWLPDRVFPRERIGVEKELRDIGLEKYNVIAIIKKFKGRHLTDDLSIDLSDWEGAVID